MCQLGILEVVDYWGLPHKIRSGCNFPSCIVGWLDLLESDRFLTSGRLPPTFTSRHDYSFLFSFPECTVQIHRKSFGTLAIPYQNPMFSKSTVVEFIHGRDEYELLEEGWKPKFGKSP